MRLRMGRKKRADGDMMVSVDEVRDLLHGLVDALERDEDGELVLNLDNVPEFDVELDEAESGHDLEDVMNGFEDYDGDDHDDHDEEDDDEDDHGSDRDDDEMKFATLVESAKQLDKLASLVEDRFPRNIAKQIATRIDRVSNALDAKARGGLR